MCSSAKSGSAPANRTCSGTSLRVSTHARKEMQQQANHPQIRLFTVPMRPAGEPANDVSGTWTVCTPKTVPGFAAVGYFFGRELHDQLRSAGRPRQFVVGRHADRAVDTAGRVQRRSRTGVDFGRHRKKLKRLTRKRMRRPCRITRAWLTIAQKAKENHEKIPAPPRVATQSAGEQLRSRPACTTG